MIHTWKREKNYVDSKIANRRFRLIKGEWFAHEKKNKKHVDYKMLRRNFIYNKLHPFYTSSQKNFIKICFDNFLWNFENEFILACQTGVNFCWFCIVSWLYPLSRVILIYKINLISIMWKLISFKRLKPQITSVLLIIVKAYVYLHT